MESHGQICCQVCGNPEGVTWSLISAIVAVELLSGHVFTGSTHVSTLQVAMSLDPTCLLRDRSLITGREGGYEMGRGGGQVLSLQKGGRDRF